MGIDDLKMPQWFASKPPEVQRELFVLGYRNLTVHAIAQTVLCVLITAGSWRIVPHNLVLAWSAVGALSIVGLLIGKAAFRRDAAAPVTPLSALQRWRWAHTLLLTILGIPWGGAALMMTPLDPVHNLMIMLAAVGALAQSAHSTAPHDPLAFVLSAFLASALMMSQLPMAFGPQAWVIAGMYILYFCVLTLSALNARATLLASIELRLLNESLARTNAENATRAEQANRDKSAFLAAASHDLRQPVHALLLLIEAYRQQVPAAAQHPLMQHITAAGQSIRSLFEALMELSQLESGTEKPVRMRFDLHDSVRGTLAGIRPVAQSKGLMLRTRIAANLPAHTLFTDKLWLERILSNLLSNAVKYTVRGGVLFSVRRAQGSGGLWLEVWDTGIGISPQDQARIFEPYTQVGNRERDRAKGLGLGLAIVRDAARLLDMEVSVHSRVGRGSCFRLHLPAGLLQHDRLAERSAAPAASATPAPYLAGRRLLLVDDDPMVRQAMQALLPGWGIDLRCAVAGDASVLDLCGADWPPECVLSDFRLPGSLDGIALLDLLLERYSAAVGILQTGELAAAVKDRAEEAGYLVLFKPVDAALLASTLNAVLQPPRPAAELAEVKQA